MGTKQLSLNQKARWKPIIMERDFPDGKMPICFYCKQEFIAHDAEFKQEWEHLNNNPGDNRPENLVWAHARCNEIKKKKAEWQVLAIDKLNENVRWHSESLGGGGGNNTAHTQTQPNEQIEANSAAIGEAEMYLIERLLPLPGKPAVEERLDFYKTADTIAYRCYRKYRHGSQNTTTRILRMLTCDDAQFTTEKKDGREWIVRRTGR